VLESVDTTVGHLDDLVEDDEGGLQEAMVSEDGDIRERGRRRRKRSGEV
jgi:hypothetical protein